MTGDITLLGARVGLRDWRLEDLAAYREWLRPQHEWHAWDGPHFPRPTDARADQMCEDLRRRINAADWSTPRTSLVIADRGSEVLVGSVSWYYESEVTDWRRTGVVLYDPASWSRGRGTEAAQLWTDYLFAHHRDCQVGFCDVVRAHRDVRDRLEARLD